MKGLLVEGRIYILNRSSSAPDLDDFSRHRYGTKGSWFEVLKHHSSSGAADTYFFDTQFLADNVAPSKPDAMTVPLPSLLDRLTIAPADLTDGKSRIGNDVTQRREEVTCLLLFGGNYGNMLSARYFVVLSPCEPDSLGAIAHIDIAEYYKTYYTQREPQKSTSFRRIGLCAFDRRQICQESAQHDLSTINSYPCLGQIMTVDIIQSTLSYLKRLDRKLTTL